MENTPIALKWGEKYLDRYNETSTTMIVDPNTGDAFQINSEYNLNEVYSLGDEVNWGIDENWPLSGKLLDGFYCSLNVDDSWERTVPWVIIKDHKIHAIEYISDFEGSRDLNNKYDIQHLPDSCWSEKAWRAQKETLNQEIDYIVPFYSFSKDLEKIIAEHGVGSKLKMSDKDVYHYMINVFGALKFTRKKDV